MTAPAPLVLVAEDEPLASMALRAQLEAVGYRVLGPAHNGDDALALGACFPIDIGLFDFRMPRRTGIEAATALFELAPTPIVLLSGFDSGSLPHPIPRPPIFASLSKPAELRDLRQALDAAFLAFDHWIGAQPDRTELVNRRRSERVTIANTVETLARGSTLRDVAARLFEQATREDRPLLEIALDCLAPER